MSTANRPALPLTSDILDQRDPLENLRRQILELLASEKRAMHTGEIAGAMGVMTHRVQTALHHPYQTGKVHFTSSEGWTIAAPFTPLQSHDDGQGSL